MRLSVKGADVSGATRKAVPIEKAAVGAYAMAAIRDAESLVPYLTGALRGTAHSESMPEEGKVIYGSAAVPYARAQYYSCPHKNWPGTTTEWFPKAKERHGDAWACEAQAAAKEATGR